MNARSIRWTTILLCVAIAAAFTGCAKDEGSSGYDIIDQPIQGVINGKAFTLLSGWAEASTFVPGDYELELRNIATNSGFDPWALGAYPLGSSYQAVLLSFPMAVGTYELDLESQTVTLYDQVGSDNIICDEGSIRIDSISGGYVTGAIAARPSDDDSDYVNGTFSVPIKP